MSRRNVAVPHAGPGTHTLVVAIEIDNRLITNPTHRPAILDRIRQLAGHALDNHQPDRSRMLLATVLLGEVARQHGMHPEQLTARDRSTDVARARQEAMWLAYRRAGLSFTEAGELFGRDHTTVVHGVLKIDGLLETDEILGRWLDHVWETVTTSRRAAA